MLRLFFSLYILSPFHCLADARDRRREMELSADLERPLPLRSSEFAAASDELTRHRAAGGSVDEAASSTRLNLFGSLSQDTQR